MSVALRIILIFGSLICFFFVMRMVKKTKMRIESSIFWIMFVFFIVIIALFPEILIYGAVLIGVDSTVNLVYLIMLFILILEIFMLSIKVSMIENRLNSLVQQIAIREKEKDDESK